MSKESIPTDIEPPPDRERYSYIKNGVARERRIVDTVLVASILGLASTLIGMGLAISNVKETMAALNTAQGFLRDQVTELRADMREVQGRQFRGVAGYGEIDADERQP